MKKKILVGVGAVVVVLAIVIAIGVANLGRIIESQKPRLLAQAKKTTGRDISIGDVGVSIWPSIGVRVDNVVVSDDPAFSTEPFVTCDDVVINVKIRPLLSRRVEVGRLVVNRPQVNVTRDAQGKFNFDSMIATSGGAAGEGEVSSESETPAAALPLVLAYADIKDGTVRLSDASTRNELTLRKLNAKAEDVSADSEVSFEIHAAVFSDDPDVRVEGTAGPIGEFSDPTELSGVPVTVDVRMGPISVTELERYAPDPAALGPIEPLALGSAELTGRIVGTLGALVVEDLELSVDALKSKRPNVFLSMEIGPLNVVDPGGIDPGSVPLAGTARFDPIPLGELGRVATTAGAFPGLRVAGNASLAAKLSGSPDALGVELEFDASSADIAMADHFSKPAGTTLRAQASLGLSPERVTVRKSELAFHTLRLAATGALQPDPLGPSSDITVDVEKLDIAGFKDLVPALAPFDPEGNVAGTVRVRMQPGQEKPLFDGAVVVTGGGATVEGMLAPIERVGARITLEGQSARVTEASATLGQTTFNAAATVRQFEPMEATFQITSTAIHRTDFNTPPKPSPRPEIFRNVAINGLLRRSPEGTVSVAGDARSPQGVVSNIDYTDLQAAFTGTPERIVLERFAMNALGGSMSGKGTFEPVASLPRFDVVTQVRQVNLAEYFTYKFRDLPKFIEGRIDLDLSLNGAGRTWEQMQPTLSGGGGALVVRGALLNVNVARELLESIQKLPLVPASFSDRMKSRYQKLFTNDKTVFENLKGDLTVENGRVKTNGVLMKTDHFTVSGDGWFSFDRKMDMNTTFVFNNELTADIVAQIPQAKYLLRSDGRLELPLRLSGDAVKPTPGLNQEAVTAKLQKGLVQGGVDDLKGKVKDLLGGIGKEKKEGD